MRRLHFSGLEGDDGPFFRVDMKNFKPCDRELFFSRLDPADPRLGELVQRGDGADRKTAEVALFGYPDDDGIRLNGGRLGARNAPTEIRRWLYRMTPHLERQLKSLVDCGDLDMNVDLDARYRNAASAIQEALGRKSQCLTLGGGNDYAYPDGLAFLRAFSGQDVKPLIMNIDAHFDVRPTDKGFNSGTPFRALLESEFKFEFVEFGIQSHCNARAHAEFVKSKNGHVLTIDEYLESGLSLIDFASRKLGHLWKNRPPCFLAVDLDAFALPYANGTSAAWPLGLLPHEFYPLFQMWLKHLDVRVLGLYEVSPPLDSGVGTAKWAAQIAHGFLHHV